MSWLLFLDESGHDRKTTPYEVHGGLALHASRLWAFAQEMQRLELDSFGTQLSQFRKELKGCKLLDKDRYRWALQSAPMAGEARRKHCRGFLTRGLEKTKPTRQEFTAYGQACLEMARGAFQLFREHDARLFASAIPTDVRKPDTFKAEEYLRKDLVFLLQRYFDFLEHEQEDGLLVMDEVDKVADRRLVRRLERYFTKTQKGRYRTAWIVPTPFFVASDMTCPVQASDLAIYCVNWGFRLPKRGMDAPTRPEIADEFGPWLNQLQFRGDSYEEGSTYVEYGIVFVRDPYSSA